jgi:hypothetical protein
MVNSPLHLLSIQPWLMLVIAGDPKTFPMLLLPLLELNTINRMFMVPAHLRHISLGWIPCRKEVKSRHHLANDPTKKNHFTIIGMAANGLVMSLPSSMGSMAAVLTSKTLLGVDEVQDATTIRQFLHHGLAKSEKFDLAYSIWQEDDPSYSNGRWSSIDLLSRDYISCLYYIIYRTTKNCNFISHRHQNFQFQHHCRPGHTEIVG